MTINMNSTVKDSILLYSTLLRVSTYTAIFRHEYTLILCYSDLAQFLHSWYQPTNALSKVPIIKFNSWWVPNPTHFGARVTFCRSPLEGEHADVGNDLAWLVFLWSRRLP
jgi:hypothetical protein